MGSQIRDSSIPAPEEGQGAGVSLEGGSAPVLGLINLLEATWSTNEEGEEDGWDYFIHVFMQTLCT